MIFTEVYNNITFARERPRVLNEYGAFLASQNTSGCFGVRSVHYFHIANCSMTSTEANLKKCPPSAHVQDFQYTKIPRVFHRPSASFARFA